MTAVEMIADRIKSYRGADAFYWREKTISYVDFVRDVDEWLNRFDGLGIKDGDVCAIVGDYSPRVCSLILALIQRNAIIVPLVQTVEIDQLLAIADAEHIFRFDFDDQWTHETTGMRAANDLIVQFRPKRKPGLVAFTSGSTGKPKGILHDCERVMRKFMPLRSAERTVLFLMFDHFGGFNTLLGSLAYGGTGVCLAGHSPHSVCETIQASAATLLPTTPTFLNLLIASGSWKKFDLSSIRLITYGTEIMADATLDKIRTIFPKAYLKQTYGLSELGVLRSKSKSESSTWVKIGGDGFETKIVDGILWVRSEANMIGYLNAPQPFDADGWMCTGDRVLEQDGYLRFLGRDSDIINVGGQKVFPAEVEDILLTDRNVADVSVLGVAHPLLGKAVSARIVLREAEDHDEAKMRLRDLCLARLSKFKVPMRMEFVSQSDISGRRFKKNRSAQLLKK